MPWARKAASTRTCRRSSLAFLAMKSMSSLWRSSQNMIWILTELRTPSITSFSTMTLRATPLSKLFKTLAGWSTSDLGSMLPEDHPELLSWGLQDQEDLRLLRSSARSLDLSTSVRCSCFRSKPKRTRLSRSRSNRPKKWAWRYPMKFYFVLLTQDLIRATAESTDGS